jgi:multiple sugar transport system substrate-binding protein
MSNLVLNGITWGHSRGITPLLAASQRFSELHPGVEISWKKRSLQEFADYPIEDLTKHYDLLIIDHPWVGRAAATNCVLPLDEHLPEAYLGEQLKNSTGQSHQSYQYNGHQWALAIDAATPVASYRGDLLEYHGEQAPRSWHDLMALAQKGKVAIPSIPIDLLMAFYMFCIAHGQAPFTNEEAVIDADTGLKALASMKELWDLVDRKMFDCNPIAVAEMMTATDDYWYCPFAYGYSNYARKGYAARLLTYADMTPFSNGSKLRSTLGGTGLSVSAFSRNIPWALRFTSWVVSPEVQSALYVQHGGQPGHRKAWTDEDANRNANNYFVNTLDAVERAFVRPRYNGYLHFQDHAGTPLHRYLFAGGDPGAVLEEMNRLYQESSIRQKS